MAFNLSEYRGQRFPPDRLVENRRRIAVREAVAGAGLRPGLLANVVVYDCQNRPWWRCRCGCRTRYLYEPDFLCRKCCGLSWSCQHVTRTLPELHRIRRWRRMLKVDEAPFSPIPRLPRARHRQHELMHRIWVEEQRLIEHLARINTDLERRLDRVRAGSRRSRRLRNGQKP